MFPLSIEYNAHENEKYQNFIYDDSSVYLEKTHEHTRYAHETTVVQVPPPLHVNASTRIIVTQRLERKTSQSTETERVECKWMILKYGNYL